MSDDGHLPISDEELAAMRARCDSASDLPWFAIVDFEGVAVVYVDRPGYPTFPAMAFDRYLDAPADAEFVAAARADVPRLLDEIDRLKAIVRDLDQILSDHEERC